MKTLNLNSTAETLMPMALRSPDKIKRHYVGRCSHWSDTQTARDRAVTSVSELSGAFVSNRTPFAHFVPISTYVVIGPHYRDVLASALSERGEE